MPWRGLILLGLLVLLFTRLLKGKSRPGEKIFINEDLIQSVYNSLISEGFNHFMAQVITAQAAFETGNFTSPLFKENNNLFGMTDGSGRNNKQFGVDLRGFGVYKSIENSITDYRLYYMSQNYPAAYPSIDSYIEDLKSHKYFTADLDLYLNGVKHYYKQFFVK